MSLKSILLSVMTEGLQAVRRLSTTKDDRTPDIIALGGLFLGLQFLLLAGWSVIHQNNAFDPMNYGGGAAALLGAIGAAMRLRPDSHHGDPQ